MKTQNMSVRILATLFICAATQVSAQPGTTTIEPVASFGPSFAGSRTYASDINSQGDIAGTMADLDQDHGFVRFRNRTYAIIVHPDERPGSTGVHAINDLGLIAGDYFGNLNGVHMWLGFFFSDDTYTDFVITGADNTHISALNNAGDFAGTADFSPSDLFHPYISIGGNVTLFSLPGSPFFTLVGGMNNLNQVIGYYSSEGGNHGYIRNADGTMTFPIDYPGALHTFLYGINDKGWMVGAFVDTEFVTHGLFLSSPTSFVVFDFPSSRETVLTGINNQGKICGYYEASGVIFALVARVTLPSG